LPALAAAQLLLREVRTFCLCSTFKDIYVLVWQALAVLMAA
jgi:hypothetical protein